MLLKSQALVQFGEFQLNPGERTLTPSRLASRDLA